MVEEFLTGTEMKLGLASSRKLSWSLFLLLGSSETVSEQFLLLILGREGSSGSGQFFRDC